MQRRNAFHRFAEQVCIGPASDCWHWTGAVHKTRGYGVFNIFLKAKLAHRVSYKLFIGDVPDGMVLDHLCRNRLCVNPGHLEPVTSKENSNRSPLLRELHWKRKRKLGG